MVSMVATPDIDADGIEFRRLLDGMLRLTPEPANIPSQERVVAKLGDFEPARV